MHKICRHISLETFVLTCARNVTKCLKRINMLTFMLIFDFQGKVRRGNCKTYSKSIKFRCLKSIFSSVESVFIHSQGTVLLVCRQGAARFVKSLLCCLISDTLRKMDRAVENILISSKFACVIIKSQPSRALSKNCCFASSFAIALY